MSPYPAPRRILVYTHNSIGLGHAVRTMAVIDGLRAALPGTDFLVLTGSSAPQIFLSEGVEVVKLPGIKHELDAPGAPYRPRHLRTLGRDEILSWRSGLIRQCMQGYAPDVVVVEHSLAGLMGEALPILAARFSGGSFVLAHVSRGIYGDRPLLLAPRADYDGLPPGTSLPRLYDRLYVLEDRSCVDVNEEFLGGDPALESNLRYLGRIAACNPDEDTADALAALKLQGRPYALVSLGRHGPLASLHARVLRALHRLDPQGRREVLVAPDPYLSAPALAEIRQTATENSARVIPFLPKLARLVASADLVVCRAGYNTVNDVLLGGVPALVIPERHPSREQERRGAGLFRTGLQVLDEESVLEEGVEQGLEERLERLLSSLPEPLSASETLNFDRFRIGQVMAQDLCGLLERRKCRP